VRAKPPVARAAPAPADATALLARAHRQADQGDYPGAAAACREALAADPNCADAYYLLGMVSECQHQRGAAGDYWRRCVYLKPDHYEALCHLALLAEQNGDTPQAAVFRQRAARIYARHNNGNSR
jgi:chemotaxis protein methyltransferase WspC